MAKKSLSYSLECSERVLGDAGVVAKVPPRPDGGEDQRVPVVAARHPDRVGRVQQHAVLVPADLKSHFN